MDEHGQNKWRAWLGRWKKRIEHGWDGFDGLSQIRMNNRDIYNY